MERCTRRKIKDSVDTTYYNHASSPVEVTPPSSFQLFPFTRKWKIWEKGSEIYVQDWPRLSLGFQKAILALFLKAGVTEEQLETLPFPQDVQDALQAGLKEKRSRQSMTVERLLQGIPLMDILEEERDQELTREICQGWETQDPEPFFSALAHRGPRILISEVIMNVVEYWWAMKTAPLSKEERKKVSHLLKRIGNSLAEKDTGRKKETTEEQKRHKGRIRKQSYDKKVHSHQLTLHQKIITARQKPPPGKRRLDSQRPPREIAKLVTDILAPSLKSSMATERAAARREKSWWDRALNMVPR